eukprot:3912969-Amphidinium_carterae.1
MAKRARVCIASVLPLCAAAPPVLPRPARPWRWMSSMWLTKIRSLVQAVQDSLEDETAVMM